MRRHIWPEMDQENFNEGVMMRPSSMECSICMCEMTGITQIYSIKRINFHAGWRAMYPLTPSSPLDPSQQMDPFHGKLKMLLDQIDIIEPKFF